MLFQGIEPRFPVGDTVALPNSGSYLRIKDVHFKDGEWRYSGDVYVVMHRELHDKQEHRKDISESALQPIPKLPPRRC